MQPNPPPDNGDGRSDYLEIPLGRQKRWIGLISYCLIFLAVSGLLVLLFVRFTGSLKLAIALVAFLVSYMLLMGWWTSRNLEQGDR